MLSDVFFFWRQGNWLRNALFLALAGMEMAWLTPIVISLNKRSWQTPGLLFMLGLGTILVIMMLVANYLSLRQVDSPAFELAVLAAIVLMGLLVLRLYVFWGEPVFSMHWLTVLFAAADPRRIEVFWVLGVMAYLWWRGISFLQRQVGFFVIGLDFRKGVLGLIAGVVVFSKLVGQSPTLFIYAFFFFSLMAVALGRIEDKMRARGDAGPGLSASWLLVLGTASGGVLLLAAGLHWLWSLRHFVWLGRILTPLTAGLMRVLEPLFLFFLSLLEPIFQWLIHFIQSRMGPDAATAPLITLPPSAAEMFGQNGNGELPGSQVPPWLIILFRYILPILLMVLVLFVLVLWLERHRTRRHPLTATENRQTIAKEDRRGLGDVLQQGWQRLRNWADLVGRYGLGRRFYAALSVRHLYANLQHLAAQRGYPRARAQTPNDYLPQLQQAFPGQETALAQLTHAYNVVEYGHAATSEVELEHLGAAWAAIRIAAQETPPAM